MPLNVNIDTIKNLPNYQRALILGMIIVVIVGGFVWLAYLPQNDRLQNLKNEIEKINNEVKINEDKSARLEELRKEKDDLQVKLAELKEQLPPEEEVAGLLKQISDLGVQTGLDFKLWKPAGKKQNPQGLYAENPVNVEVTGGYHELAVFFDKVGKLSRIVNVTDLKMASPKIEKGKILIQASFVATAFASVEKGPKEGKTDSGGDKK